MFENVWRGLVGRHKSARKQRQGPAPRLELLEDRCLLTAPITIVTSPLSASIVAGQTATFKAAATGAAPTTVQWEMSPAGGNSFAPLANNALFSGVNTDTLTVIGTTALSGDEFEAVFSTGALPDLSAATTPAILTVTPATETAPAISHMSTNNWTQGLTNFTGTMTISGGTAPFAVTSYANLPPGVTPAISGNLITFTGPPTVAQTYSACTVTIKDADGTTATKTFVINVEPALTVGNLTQTQWTVGQAGFGGLVHIGGGTGTYSLVSSSGLPAGLTAKVGGGTIYFTGVPTAVGASPNCSVTVADADGATVTANFAITINAVPTLSAMDPLQWTAGTTGYTGAVTITGGTGPYSVSTYAYMPFNITVSGNTVYFTGDAPARVYYNATFTIRDQAGATATDTSNITINPVVTYTSVTPSQWTVGQPGYDGTSTLTYGTQPFTITSFSALPTGLTPSVSGGTLSITGTPSVAGTFSGGSIALEDSGGEIFSVPVNITINRPLTFTTTALPIVTPGAGYSANLSTTGGTGGDTFALANGTTLPAGLTLQSNGHLTGTTSAVGSFSFAVTATDAAGAHATDTFNIAVSPAISLGNLTQTQWTAGQSGFNGTIAIKGGDGSFTLTSATGLPAGLSATLSGRTIKITGTPSTPGTSSVAITVVDSDGISTSENISITINGAPTIGTLAAIPWTAGIGGYPVTMAISGGTGPYTIVSSHGLPFNPIVSGNTILLLGSGGAGLYSNGVIKLRDAAGATVTANIAPIVINPLPTISHMSVNNWTEGTPKFPGTLTISYGTGPFTIVTTKNIPLGLTPYINGSTIAFTGTPEVAETVNSTITIRDAAGALATKIFIFDIAPPIMITTMHLPAWTSGVNYTATVKATGGTGPLTFTLIGAPLPAGLTLKSNGKITGKATVSGPFTFTVLVTDSVGATASETFTL